MDWSILPARSWCVLTSKNNVGYYGLLDCGILCWGPTAKPRMSRALAQSSCCGHGNFLTGRTSVSGGLQTRSGAQHVYMFILADDNLETAIKHVLQLTIDQKRQLGPTITKSTWLEHLGHPAPAHAAGGIEWVSKQSGHPRVWAGGGNMDAGFMVGSASNRYRSPSDRCWSCDTAKPSKRVYGQRVEPLSLCPWSLVGGIQLSGVFPGRVVCTFIQWPCMFISSF